MKQGCNSIAHCLPWIATLALGLIFIGSSYHKIVDPQGFAVSIFRYRLLPFDSINLLAVYLPWLELVCAFCVLAVPKFRRPAALLLIGMLLVFTSAILLNLFRGIDISCGCFSHDPDKGHAGWVSVVRNLSLIALGGIVYRSARKR
ncbi:MAG: DoxX family membrane protein [Candidatus Omnitrophica bacterium]|nr:DoxX family membrane protein [Candidatus Omnitrophota bacterium]